MNLAMGGFGADLIDRDNAMRLWLDEMDGPLRVQVSKK